MPDDLPEDPQGLPPYDDGDEDAQPDDELFESERNMERILEYLELMTATDIDQTGSFERDDQSVNFTISVEDPPQTFRGFACFIKDAWVDICLLRDWSNNVRLKFRDRAADIMNTIGLHGVSLYFMANEDTLYMCHRVFTEGLNFDVFRACIWSLLSAQSRVAGILERDR